MLPGNGALQTGVNVQGFCALGDHGDQLLNETTAELGVLEPHVLCSPGVCSRCGDLGEVCFF